MNYARMEEIQEAIFDRVRAIRETKGREYAHDEETLADFKEIAAEVGITPLQCWAVYVKKHLRALDTAVRESGQIKSESIESRVDDVVCYMPLLLGLIEDEMIAEARIERERELASRADQFDRVHDLDAEPSLAEAEAAMAVPGVGARAQVLMRADHVPLSTRKPTPWDILSSHMGARIDGEEIAAIRDELRIHGWGGELVVNGTTMSYISP